LRKIVLDLVIEADGALARHADGTPVVRETGEDLNSHWIVRITTPLGNLPGVDYVFDFPGRGRTWGAELAVDGNLANHGLPEYIKVRPGVAYTVELWAPSELQDYFTLGNVIHGEITPGDAAGTLVHRSRDGQIDSPTRQDAALDLAAWPAIADAQEWFDPIPLLVAPASPIVNGGQIAGLEIRQSAAPAAVPLAAPPAAPAASSISRAMVQVAATTVTMAPQEVVEVTWVSVPTVLEQGAPVVVENVVRTYVRTPAVLTNTGADLIPLVAVAALLVGGVLFIVLNRRKRSETK